MQINLLPGQLQKRRAAILLQDIKRMFLRFLYIWLALWIIFLFLIARISLFKKKFIQIESDWKITEPLLKERNKIIKQKSELGEFLVFIKKHSKRGLLWSEKLIALSKLTPDEIWLNELSLRKEKKENLESLLLDVAASVSYLNNDEEMLVKINTFIEQLKKDTDFFKDFQNLSLAEINKATGSDRVMNFRFSLSLKPEL